MDEILSQAPPPGQRERRHSPRMRAEYPVRVQYQISDDTLAWFSHTANVSSDGLLVALPAVLEAGAEVKVSLAIPVGSNSCLPAAQLDGPAVVLRCEPAELQKNRGCSRLVALKFLSPPLVSTIVSMFE